VSGFSRTRSPAGSNDGEGDYLNCPLTRDEYEAFYTALTSAESATRPRLRQKERFFEGCLPIRSDGATRHRHARFGPMKLVGLNRSADGARAVRVRAAAARKISRAIISASSAPTQIKWGDQARVLRLIQAWNRPSSCGPQVPATPT